MSSTRAIVTVTGAGLFMLSNAFAQPAAPQH